MGVVAYDAVAAAVVVVAVVVTAVGGGVGCAACAAAETGHGTKRYAVMMTGRVNVACSCCLG